METTLTAAGHCGRARIRNERGNLSDHLRSCVVEERERTTRLVLETLLNGNPKAIKSSEGFMPFLQKLLVT